MTDESLLSTVQVAHLLNLHPDTLRVWRKQQRGPAWVRLGSRYRYSRVAIDEFLSARQGRAA